MDAGTGKSTVGKEGKSISIPGWANHAPSTMEGV